MGLLARAIFKLEQRGTRRLEQLVTAAKAAAAQRASGSKGQYVKVGLLGTGAKQEGGITTVQLGIIHEFGAPAAGIPERSFLRATIHQHRPEYMRLLRALGRRFVRDGDPGGIRKALALVGQRASADVKKLITSGEPIPPPNTPEVFLRKLAKNEEGFNRTGLAPRTLVDTGRMVNAISYEVVPGGPKPDGGGAR